MHYACKNDCFWLFSWSSLHLANVNSVGTRNSGRTEDTAFFVSNSNLVGRACALLAICRIHVILPDDPLRHTSSHRGGCISDR